MKKAKTIFTIIALIVAVISSISLFIFYGVCKDSMTQIVYDVVEGTIGSAGVSTETIESIAQYILSSVLTIAIFSIIVIIPLVLQIVFEKSLPIAITVLVLGFFSNTFAIVAGILGIIYSKQQKQPVIDVEANSNIDD